LIGAAVSWCTWSSLRWGCLIPLSGHSIASGTRYDARSVSAAPGSSRTPGGRSQFRRFLGRVGAFVLVLGGCSDVSFVDSITIVNDTEYSAESEVTGADRDGWLGLTLVPQRTTTTVEEVVDQGETWIFRFDYVGKYEEEIEVSRRELEQNDWTIEVPPSFAQHLRDLGVPPPPP
jgi:hypothetical protein